MKAVRRYLTKNERSAMHFAQGGLCACGCDRPLGEKFIAEHWTCVAMGNGEKPDALLRVDCAAIKTTRDIKAIAKVKRLRGETCNGPKRPIRSRGFDKTRSRRMDGSVVERKNAATVRRDRQPDHREAGQ